MKPIRNSAKAIIIQNGKLLATKNQDQFGVFYLLPGGGQEPGETIYEALIRECLEEISAEVEIGEVRFIREYIGKNHEFREFDSDVHQIEYMFLCTLKPGSKLCNGSVPDCNQIGVEWLDLRRFSEYRIYPKALALLILADGQVSGKIYLGDVN
jgi:8-oxo-dGTP diphosphatase